MFPSLSILLILAPISLAQAICNIPSASAWCTTLITACSYQSLQSPLTSQICVSAQACSPQTQSYLTCLNGGTTVLLTGSLPLGSTITQQNFIDLIFSALKSSNTAVWPSAADVIYLWSQIVSWANRGANIPQSNFKDYLLYYRPAVAGSTSNTIAPNPTSTITQQYTQQCSEQTLTCPAAPNVHCASLFADCLKTDVAYRPPFTTISCTLAAACFPSVSAFSQALSCAVPATRISGNSQLYGRLGSPVFSYLSAGGTTVSQQSFIDAYYGQLTFINALTYPEVAEVIAMFSRISSWTGYNTAVPSGNLADWFNYSNN